MGCHMWLYKKVKSLSENELLEKIKEAYREIHNAAIVQSTKEEWVKDIVEMYLQELEELQPLLDSGEIDKDDCNVVMAREFSDPEKVGNDWERYHKKFKDATDAYMNFLKNGDYSYDTFVEVYVKVKGESKEDAFWYHKNEPYLNTVFDTYFRCFKFPDESRRFDSSKNIINYLKSVHPNMIEQYGEFVEDKFVYFDSINYTPKKGLTKELEDMIEYLFRNDDIFIEFG